MLLAAGSVVIGGTTAIANVCSKMRAPASVPCCKVNSREARGPLCSVCCCWPSRRALKPLRDRRKWPCTTRVFRSWPTRRANAATRCRCRTVRAGAHRPGNRKIEVTDVRIGVRTTAPVSDFRSRLDERRVQRELKGSWLLPFNVYGLRVTHNDRPRMRA